MAQSCNVHSLAAVAKISFCSVTSRKRQKTKQQQKKRERGRKTNKTKNKTTTTKKQLNRNGLAAVVLFLHQMTHNLAPVLFVACHDVWRSLTLFMVNAPFHTICFFLRSSIMRWANTKLHVRIHRFAAILMGITTTTVTRATKRNRAVWTQCVMAGRHVKGLCRNYART